MGRVKPRYHGSGDGSGHLGTHRVWERVLKLLSTTVRARVRVIFTNAGMGMGICSTLPIRYPLPSLRICHSLLSLTRKTIASMKKNKKKKKKKRKRKRKRKRTMKWTRRE
ncbi:hypothetical protein MTR_8g468670 [Medicago truncatula]|uniref:Uncharacterized protein n=1 Tax=Medicago truncatula TaxID=3880 RepID=A0A072TSG4_MEDTR|nr:hypothetical protein MTR_8g468670 [Medicago truncatula]